MARRGVAVEPGVELLPWPAMSTSACPGVESVLYNLQPAERQKHKKKMQQKCKERAAGGPKGKYQQQQQLAGATTTSIAIYCLMHLRKFMQIPKNTYFTLGAGTRCRENSAR